MRFLIVGDLHGQKPKIHYKDCDAIIAPGDFCSDNLRKYMFQAIRKNSKSNKRVSWYELAGKTKARKMIKKSLKDGKKILKFLDSFNIPVFIVPGNWDWTPQKGDWDFLARNNYKDFLLKGSRNIIDVYHKKKDYKDVCFIGHGATSAPEYPQDKKDIKNIPEKMLKKYKKSYEKIFNKLDRLFKKTKNKKTIIFISHNVPYNTKLDILLNKSLPVHGKHMGSVISRSLIKKHQPLICIGGHMHEHFGKDKIGKTIVINTGFGKNVNTLLEVSGGKIKKLSFWNGK